MELFTTIVLSIWLGIVIMIIWLSITARKEAETKKEDEIKNDESTTRPESK